jgi:hypothetical protein
MCDAAVDFTAIALASRALLVTGADLTQVARQLPRPLSAPRLRRAILAGAQTDAFADAVISAVPPALAPAVRELLRTWPAEDANERTQLRRLRRALTTAEQMQRCFCAAMDASTGDQR